MLNRMDVGFLVSGFGFQVLGSERITPLIHHSRTPVDTYGSSPSTVPTPFKWLMSPQVCRNQFPSS
jgi:hypothetical protein